MCHNIAALDNRFEMKHYLYSREALLFWYFQDFNVVVVLIKISLVKVEEWLGSHGLSTRSNNKTVYLKMVIKIENDGERILVLLEAKEVKLR